MDNQLTTAMGELVSALEAAPWIAFFIIGTVLLALAVGNK